MKIETHVFGPIVHNNTPPKHNKLFIDADLGVGVVVSADIYGDALINSNVPDCVIWFTDGLIIRPLSTIVYPIRYLESSEEIVTLSN